MKNNVKQAIDSQLGALSLSAREKARLIENARSDRRIKRKLSAALVLTIALVLMCAAALAVSSAMGIMTKTTAKMSAQGQLEKWGLDEKLAFVYAMREAGLEMNEEDFALLSDEGKDASERESAADRIIFERYGSVQSEENAGYVQPIGSVFGKAPSPVAVFRERFLSENPNADDYDYLDALGYWLRDEYEPEFAAALPAENKPAEAPVTALDKDSAEDAARSYLSEVLGVSGAKNASIMVSEKDGVFYAVCTIPKADAGTLDAELLAQFEQSGEKLVITLYIAQTDAGSIVVRQSLDELSEQVAFQNRVLPLYTVYIDEAQQLARRAVMDKYGLTDAEMDRYFVYDGDYYYDDESAVRVGILFRTRNNSGAPWAYAAIVNFTTAKAEDVFTPEDLLARLPLLAENWETLGDTEKRLGYFRWYTTWNPYGYFGEWSLEMQAEASRLFMPIKSRGDERDSELLADFCSHAYSMPQTGELSEAEALALAKKAAAELYGLAAGDTSGWTAQRTFSRDEGEAPTWRFVLTESGGAQNRAVIWIDAESGEIIYKGETAPNGKRYFYGIDAL